MPLQGVDITCIRGWEERRFHVPIIPQKRGETQRVRFNDNVLEPLRESVGSRLRR